MRTRLVSAAVLIPSVVLVVYLGGVYLVLATIAAGAIAGYELLTAVRRDGTSPQGPARPSRALGIVFVALLIADAQWPDLGILGLALPVVVLGGLLAQVFRDNAPGALNGWALTVAGGLYIGLSLSYIVRLRNGHADGYYWVVVGLTGTWICDTAALLVGRARGRRPFFPQISPKKTWEGAVAGVVVGTVAVLLAIELLPLQLSLGMGLLLGLLISLASTFGDLAESVIKRQIGIKDLGSIIPGHGGMLDRIDSMLFVFPVISISIGLLGL